MENEIIIDRCAPTRGQPKWMDEKTKRRRSKLQETDVASKLCGTVQPGSGNQNHSPGDVKTQKVLVECKTTKHKSYRVTINLIKKVREEAKSTNKEWAIVLDMEDTVYHDKERVAVMDFDLFAALIGRLHGFEEHA